MTQLKPKLNRSMMMMEVKWKHNQFFGIELPDQYRLALGKNHFIEIKGNPFKGKIKIKITNPTGDCNESVISNGVVIDERDVNINRSKSLEHFFASYHQEISSLPDNGLLKIIGNNYGVLVRTFNQKNISHNNNKTDSDILLQIFRKGFKIFKNYFKIIFRRPQILDFFDSLIITIIGISVYYQNFNYLSSGVFTASTAIFTGYCDWLIRKRSPYLIKIIIAFFIGGYLFYFGWLYQ